MDLTGMRSRVRSILMDESKLGWDDASLDEAVREALDDYSLLRPLVKAAIITLAADGPEVDLSGLADFTDLIQVFAPWSQAALPEENIVRGWTQFWDGTQPKAVLYTRVRLKSGDRVRVRYATKHLLQGLDGAEVSTVYQSHESILARGAAGYAARNRAVDCCEGFGSQSKALEKLFAWGKEQLLRFSEDLIHIRPRGWALEGLPGGWDMEG